MKLATIDIGSNSIHLLIVDVDEDGHFRAIDREREMVRLGAQGLTAGHLAPDAIDRALGALTRFADLARAHGCSQIIATATSAVREADNGDKFVKRVLRRTGIDVDLLSGVEEARLIARAVGYVRELNGSSTLGIDIGGGSTEFWILRGGEPKCLLSNRLGSVRLTEDFVHSDPISKRDQERLKGFIIGTMARTRREVLEAGFDSCILTSGTAITLAQMAYTLTHGQSDSTTLPLQDTEGFELTAEELRRITKMVTRSSLRDRKKIPGLPAERADIIVAGAILLDTIFSEFGIKRAQTCDWSLREGVLIDYLDKRFGTAGRRVEAGDGLEMSDIRRRAVLALARRCEYDAGHARQTAILAKQIFDQTQDLHRLDCEARSLLEVAAYLHDIGYTISHTMHSRHAQYLIQNSELLGFSSREIAIVGNVVRYHGKIGPKKKDPEFIRLRPADRVLVERLTAILTVADALDRSSRAAVERVDVVLGKRRATFTLTPAKDCHLELWDAQRKAPAFEKAFGLKTVFVGPPEISPTIN